MIYEATIDGRTVRVEVRGQAPRFTLLVDGKPLEIDWREVGGAFTHLVVDGRSYQAGLHKRAGGFHVQLPGYQADVDLVEAARGGSAAPRKAQSGPARLNAPMPGRIVRVLAQVGTEVEAGQGLVVIEAMKMENELKAPRAGRVREVAVRERQAVETGALLVVIE